MLEMFMTIMGWLKNNGIIDTECEFNQRLNFIAIRYKDRRKTGWVIGEDYGKFYINNAWGVHKQVTTQNVVNYL